MSVWYAIKGKRLLFVIIDAACMAAAFFASLPVTGVPSGITDLTILSLFVLVGAMLVAFYFLQVYRVIWAQSGGRDIYRLLGAALLGCSVWIIVSASIGAGGNAAWYALTSLAGTGLAVLYRHVLRDYFPSGFFMREDRLDAGLFNVRLSGGERKILIAGAGEAGRLILSEYAKKGEDRAIVGFVDDDPVKIGRMFNGKNIFSSLADMGPVVQRCGVSEVIIAMPSAGAGTVDRVAFDVKSRFPNLTVKVLPPFTRIFEKSLSTEISEFGIGELLGREEFSVDADAIHRHFSGKTVLVTGAGGSIGSEICRQLLKFAPKRLIAVGRGEYSIYQLAKSLDELVWLMDSECDIVYCIADVKDSRMLDSIFAEFHPEYVFHAAAHKHVPLMEFNEKEAVQNNVLGTMNVFDCAHRHGATGCVLISTDKAVRPVNVMGATKRIAELIALYYHRETGLRTSIVRFGNVIGSRGSAIPLFVEQIDRGGPVTVTHPDVTRYFMSIPEASLLVINAAAYSSGGEVFVLDMGRQYRVDDIARTLIRLRGYEPDRDIRIEYTGLRPGEKLYEELSYDTEKLVRTQNEKISILSGKDDFSAGDLLRFLDEAGRAIHTYNPVELRRLMQGLIREYDFHYPAPRRGKNSRLVN